MTATPNPTAEQVVSVAMQLAALTLGHKVSGSPRAGDLARYVLRHGAGAASQGRESDRLCPHVPKGESRRAGECHRCAVEAGWVIATQGDAKPIATSGERVRNQTDSSHVAPQEPCPQPCPQPCEHLSAEDAREGRDCREHPCTCPAAPSPDRERLIAKGAQMLDAWLDREYDGDRGVPRIPFVSALADALVAQPVLDPEKVAAFGEDWYDRWAGPGEQWTFRDLADALCEAAKRGDLT